MSKLPDPPYAEGTAQIAPTRRLSYAEYGDPAGDVVFWLHGTPGARRQVPLGLNAAAKENHFRVITVERPGTGKSSDHRYEQLGDFADDLSALANELGIDQFAVVGLSGGGPYTLAAARHLADRVPVVGVLGGLAPTVGEHATQSFHNLAVFAQPLLELLRKTLVPALRFGLSGLEAIADPAYRAYVKVNGGADAEVMSDPKMKHMFLNDLLRTERLRAPLHDLALFGRHWGFEIDEIEVPVHIWHGDADHIVPFEQGEHMASVIPNATLTTIPGLGHFAGFTAVDDVLSTLRATWNRSQMASVASNE